MIRYFLIPSWVQDQTRALAAWAAQTQVMAFKGVRSQLRIPHRLLFAHKLSAAACDGNPEIDEDVLKEAMSCAH